jgi:hypothetical protein
MIRGRKIKIIFAWKFGRINWDKKLGWILFKISLKIELWVN